MLRRTRARLVTFAEAQRLVSASPPTATSAATKMLPELLSTLSEHHQQGGEVFTTAALQHIVRLDQSNEDTQYVAMARVQVASNKLADQATASRFLVTELLRAYPHSPEVRERCCRCIANICQLDTNNSSDNHDDGSNGSSGALSAHPGMADTLVAEGAVELVVGTLAMAGRLSPRGRCWAATALLNLTCMSQHGAARATAVGAMDALAEFLLSLPQEAADDAGPVPGLDEETAIAMDAALGALTAVLAAEAPENASGISFNYEAVSYVAVDAVVRALLQVSALLVRDGRNDGAYGVSLPSRRYGTVSFPTASPTQQAAVVVLLPLLHKSWMALQAVCSCPRNLPMLFDVVYEAANANQESMMVASDVVVGGSEEVLEVTTQTERQYTAALSSLIDAALFLTTELEGLDEVGAEELARLQRDVRLYVMDTMQAMTAPRKDALTAQRAENEDVSGAPAVEEEVEALPIYPTAAAANVMDVLASGNVGTMALGCVVQQHTEHQTQCSQDASQRRRNGVTLPSPYTTGVFTLLSKSLVVLANVAEAGDEVATSANTVAALQAVLSDAAEVVAALPHAYGGDLAELFKPTETADETTNRQQGKEEKEDSGDLNPAATTVIDAEDRLSFLQQAALVGQVYAVLWSTLRSARGVATVTQLSVLQTAGQVRAALQDRYIPAVDAAKARYRAAGGEKDGGAATWVPNTAEESVVRLLKLSDELIRNLSKLSEADSATGASSS